MWGNVVLGGGSCKNHVRLSMFDDSIETGKYRWANNWCMLYWIVRFWHKTAEMYFLGI